MKPPKPTNEHVSPEEKYAQIKVMGIYLLEHADQLEDLIICGVPAEGKLLPPIYEEEPSGSTEGIIMISSSTDPMRLAFVLHRIHKLMQQKEPVALMYALMYTLIFNNYDSTENS